MDGMQHTARGCGLPPSLSAEAGGCGDDIEFGKRSASSVVDGKMVPGTGGSRQSALCKSQLLTIPRSMHITDNPCQPLMTVLRHMKVV